MILPAQAGQIGEMLGLGADRLPGDCRLGDVAIDGGVAVAHYACPAAEVDVSLQHRDAAPTADEVLRTEKFCIGISGRPRAPHELAELVRSRVVRGERSFEWAVLPATPAAAAGDGAARIWWSAWLVSLALLVGPPSVGYAAGALVRRVSGCGLRPGALFALVPSAAAALALSLATPRWHVGSWDGALIGALFGGGAVLGARSVSRRTEWASVALLVASTAASLGLAELASRTLLPPIRAAIPEHPPRLILDDANVQGARYAKSDGFRREACTFLYPDVHPGAFESRAPADDGRRPAVLHVGDSMVEGASLPMAQSFPQRLAELDPGTVHVNAGMAAMSVDYHLLHATRWLARRHVDRVVFYVFVGNDLDEIDQEMPCCWDGPLLDYGADDVSERCPSPASNDDAPGWHSPLPYPLRTAAQVSSLALRLVALHSLPRLPRDHETRWPHFEAVMRAARDRMAASGVGFAVVLLPLREALESAEPTRSEAYAVRTRALETCRRLGIRTLDAWDFFADAVHRLGSERVFIDRGGTKDLHFSAEGHERFARWLLERLGDLFDAPRKSR